jgi:hypothetical protein
MSVFWGVRGSAWGVRGRGVRGEAVLACARCHWQWECVGVRGRGSAWECVGVGVRGRGSAWGLRRFQQARALEQAPAAQAVLMSRAATTSSTSTARWAAAGAGGPIKSASSTAEVIYLFYLGMALTGAACFGGGVLALERALLAISSYRIQQSTAFLLPFEVVNQGCSTRHAAPTPTPTVLLAVGSVRS